MVSRITSYADAATNLVPNFGKARALTFTAGLVLETVVRYGLAEPDYMELNVIQLLKTWQSVAAFADSAYFSAKGKVGAFFITYAFQSPIVHDKFSDPNSPLLDRPRLISFVQVTGEAINIASKVIGSLATGLVVQRMVTGGVTGKIRIVVSAALLALSAYNVFNSREMYPY